MFVRTALVAALVGTAAAFAPLMSMDVDRRSVIQAGAAAAAAAPLLRSSPASAAGRGNPNRAPVVCSHPTDCHRACALSGDHAVQAQQSLCLACASSLILVCFVTADHHL